MSTILATWNQPGKVAIDAAKAKLEGGGSILDCLEAGLAAAEDDPHLIAIGRGSLPNTDGEIELDASMMEGTNLTCGAVCGVRGILPIISVARKVMATPHLMLCGDQARRFAISEGFEPQNLVTAEMVERWEIFMKSPEHGRKYVHTADDPPHDTVTMLGVREGRTAAASSTSGMPFKMPGRVGDSPIIGAGIYADDEGGCAGATGWGEELWKACASFRVVEAMKRGLTAQEACEECIRHMHRRHPNKFRLPCVVLALSPQGDHGAACGGGEFDLWIMKDGHEPVREHYMPLF